MREERNQGSKSRFGVAAKRDVKLENVAVS
jgi:hypothetical protein